MASERTGSKSTPQAPPKGTMAWVKAQRKAANVSNTPPTPAQQIYARREAISAVPTSPVYTPPTPPTPPATGDGSGQVDYGAQTVDNPAPMQPDLSDDALRKSTEYIARERAIQAMLDEFTQKQNTERTRYEGSYENALGELGYDPTKATFDLGELLTSGQRATTSGKAYNALRNDFAARGMLQSGAYQAAQGVLRNQLMKQREAIDKGRTTFLEDQNAALLGQQRAAEDQRKAALEAARQSILNSMGA